MNKSFYLYTETAFHHQGDINYLKGLIDQTNEIGADGIKFQILTKAEEFISKNHSSFDRLKEFCFSVDEWKKILEYTRKKGLDIIAMPLNISSMEVIEDIEIRYIDIHSVSFNDEELKQAIKTIKIPILLSVGGRTLEEIQLLRDFFKDQLYGLMVGFQAFPTKPEDIKLSRIKFLKKTFNSLEVGYADHSEYSSEDAIDFNLYARLLGASIFEKHLTLNEGDSNRVDHISAIDSRKMKALVNKLNRLDDLTESADESSFTMSSSELTYRGRQLRVVSKRPILKDTRLVVDDLCLRMTDQEEGFTKITDVINKKTNADISEHVPITKDILS